MTMTPEERTLLAAHYVMDLLEPSGQADAERLVASDAAFAQLVEDWRRRLAPVDMTATPEAPSPSLWDTIARTIAAPAIAAPKPNVVARFWNSMPVWRTAACIATAATLVFAVAFGVALREAQRKPAMIAVLVDGNRTGAIVHVFADGRAELLPITNIDVPAGRALQVWTLPSRERGPVSVGLLQQAHALSLALDGLPPPKPDQLFEITLEPKGGSPIGRPTGPILFKGLASPTL